MTHDSDDKDDNAPKPYTNSSGNIVQFPGSKERASIEKEKIENEKRWRKEYQKQQKQNLRAQKEPFFNFGHIPPATKIFVASIWVIHIIISLFLDSGDRFLITNMFGFVPENLTQIEHFNWYTPLTLITYTFLHGSWVHIGFNTVMALALGIMVERTFNTRTYIIFMTICTIAGALVTLVFTPFSSIPIVGASGAVSGLFGGFLILNHKSGRFGQLSTKYGAWPIIGLWTLIMIITGLIGGDIAWQAHLGGFWAGIALMTAILSGRIRL